MDRRSFLKNTATLTIVVSGGQVWRAFGQGIASEPELEPWRDWNKETGRTPLALVRAAILSSNAYNSQPWLFRVADASIDVYADVTRNLGAFDPRLREMYLSLGCALENMALAAPASGYREDIRLAHGELPVNIAQTRVFAARIDLRRARARVVDLYRAIPNRHTNREPFDAGKPLPSSFLRELSLLHEPDVKLFTFIDRDPIRQLADLVADCSGKLFAISGVREGVRPWLRKTDEEMRQHRDGFLLDAKASRYGTLEAYASLMRTGRLFGVIAVRDRYDIAQTLRAGRFWQRAHLLATERGIAARPANGAVELMDHDNEPAVRLARFTGDESWQPTFMFYMGHATVEAKASPRRSAGDVELR